MPEVTNAEAVGGVIEHGHAGFVDGSVALGAVDSSASQLLDAVGKQLHAVRVDAAEAAEDEWGDSGAFP